MTPAVGKITTTSKNSRRNKCSPRRSQHSPFHCMPALPPCPMWPTRRRCSVPPPLLLGGQHLHRYDFRPPSAAPTRRRPKTTLRLDFEPAQVARKQHPPASSARRLWGVCHRPRPRRRGLIDLRLRQQPQPTSTPRATKTKAKKKKKTLGCRFRRNPPLSRYHHKVPWCVGCCMGEGGAAWPLAAAEALECPQRTARIVQGC